MPAKPLTPEQLADADRLMALFKQQTGLTQAVLADDLGFSNQSAVSQYLKGKIPLNIEAAIRFATRFNCTVADFSPSIQAEIDRIAQHSGGNYPVSECRENTPAYHDNSKSSKWQEYSNSTEEKKAVVDFILLDDESREPEWVDSDARAYADSLEAKARRWLSGKRSKNNKKANA